MFPLFLSIITDLSLRIYLTPKHDDLKCILTRSFDKIQPSLYAIYHILSPITLMNCRLRLTLLPMEQLPDVFTNGPNDT